MAKLDVEMKKSDDLLSQMMPKSVAEKIKVATSSSLTKKNFSLSRTEHRPLRPVKSSRWSPSSSTTSLYLGDWLFAKTPPHFVVLEIWNFQGHLQAVRRHADCGDLEPDVWHVRRSLGQKQHLQGWQDIYLWCKKITTSPRWRRSRTASSAWLEPLRSKQKLPILKVARLSLKMIPFNFQTSSTFKGEESCGADYEHGDGYARLSLLCQGAAI